MTHASRDTSTGLIFEKATPINKIFGFLYDEDGETLMFANDSKSAKATGMLDWRVYVKDLPNLDYVGEGNGRHPIIWSQNYIPDGAIIRNGILYIIEKKFQKEVGTADEKLTTGEFRRVMFERLAKYFPIEIKEVKYLFILGEWFKQEKYRDRLEYVRENHPKVDFMFFDEEPPHKFFGVD